MKKLQRTEGAYITIAYKNTEVFTLHDGRPVLRFKETYFVFERSGSYVTHDISFQSGSCGKFTTRSASIGDVRNVNLEEVNHFFVKKSLAECHSQYGKGSYCWGKILDGISEEYIEEQYCNYIRKHSFSKPYTYETENLQDYIPVPRPTLYFSEGQLVFMCLNRCKFGVYRPKYDMDFLRSLNAPMLVSEIEASHSKKFKIVKR